MTAAERPSAPLTASAGAGGPLVAQERQAGCVAVPGARRRLPPCRACWGEDDDCKCGGRGMLMSVSDHSEPPRRPYTRWTPERDGELIHRYCTLRQSREEIAEAMGLGSWVAVRTRLCVLGVRRGWTAGDEVRIRGRNYRVATVLPNGDAIALTAAGVAYIISRNGLQPVVVPERQSVTRYRMRCLGPGEEHHFWSTDKRAHRMCARCRELSE